MKDANTFLGVDKALTDERVANVTIVRPAFDEDGNPVYEVVSVQRVRNRSDAEAKALVQMVNAATRPLKSVH